MKIVVSKLQTITDKINLSSIYSSTFLKNLGIWVFSLPLHYMYLINLVTLQIHIILLYIGFYLWCVINKTVLCPGHSVRGCCIRAKVAHFLKCVYFISNMDNRKMLNNYEYDDKTIIRSNSQDLKMIHILHLTNAVYICRVYHFASISWCPSGSADWPLCY